MTTIEADLLAAAILLRAKWEAKLLHEHPEMFSGIRCPKCQLLFTKQHNGPDTCGCETVN